MADFDDVDVFSDILEFTKAFDLKGWLVLEMVGWAKKSVKHRGVIRKSLQEHFKLGGCVFVHLVQSI